MANDNRFGFKVFCIATMFAIIGGLIATNGTKVQAEEMKLPLSVTDKEKIENDSETLKIVCQVPDGTPSGRLEVHYTTKQNPLYRGGWDFENIHGQRVLSTLCHCVH